MNYSNNRPNVRSRNERQTATVDTCQAAGCDLRFDVYETVDPGGTNQTLWD